MKRITRGAFACENSYYDDDGNEIQCQDAGTHICLAKVRNTLIHWWEQVEEDEDLLGQLHDIIDLLGGDEGEYE